MLLRCTKNGHLSYYERWNCETCSWLPLIALGPSNCRKYQKIMSKETLDNRCISSWAHVAWLWMILKLFVYSVNLGGPIGWFGQWSRGCRGCMFVSQWIGNFELELMPILWLRYWQCGKSKALGEHCIFFGIASSDFGNFGKECWSSMTMCIRDICRPGIAAMTLLLSGTRLGS